MWSTVTGMVLSWPCKTIPRESPTRMVSAPASETRRAKVASYAVMQTNFSPAAFNLSRVLMVILPMRRIIQRTWD